MRVPGTRPAMPARQAYEAGQRHAPETGESAQLIKLRHYRRLTSLDILEETAGFS